MMTASVTSVSPLTRAPDQSYEAVAQEFAAPLERLARGYEADIDRQRDLLQDVHLALWRGLPSFDGRSSLRTWVYRVAHNTAVKHNLKSKHHRLERCVPIEDLENAPAPSDAAREAEQRDAVARLLALVHQLRPADRQVILLYLEGFDHGEIADICGISPENAATKSHRIKRALTAALGRGDHHGT
jgi:RNA polymerase sigma-70 factor (ECF subfamily)